MTSRRVPAIAVLLAAGLAVLLAFVLPPHLVTIVSLVFVAGILASSVDMLAGQAGLMSLGHAGIAAAAAYGAAWAIGHDVALPGQLALALVVTLTVSAAYAAMTMRSRGIVFLMITLALGMVIFGLTLKLSTITGGQNGLTGLRRPPLLADPRAFYLAAALAFGLIAGFRWAFAASPFGMVLRGVRESETRMASLGYSVATAKFVAMMLSGLVAGVAGVLFVWQAEFLSPNLASFGRSANAVVMVILGGVGTLLGPLAGAVVVVGTEHWLSSYIERWPTLLGVFLIGAVLFAPRGIVGTFALRRRVHADGQPAAALLGNSATTMSSPGQSNARSTTDDDASASPHGGGS